MASRYFAQWMGFPLPLSSISSHESRESHRTADPHVPLVAPIFRARGKMYKQTRQDCHSPLGARRGILELGFLAARFARRAPSVHELQHDLGDLLSRNRGPGFA